MLGVGERRLCWAHPEQSCVEARRVVEHGADWDIARVGALGLGHPGGSELLLGKGPGQGAAGEQRLPERLEVVSSRETSSHADDRDRLSGVYGRGSVAVGLRFVR